MTRKATGSSDQQAINRTAIELLRSWRQGDEEDEREQRETGEYLIKALDEERERTGSRRLFPEHDRTS